MEKYITDERTGLKYELVGDYYLFTGDEEPEREPIGVWGLRRKNYLERDCQALHLALGLEGRLDEHLREVDQHAEEKCFLSWLLKWKPYKASRKR